MSLQGSHRCIERNTECDCPICGEYLFTSPETVVFMPCGHSIHQRCYNQHIKSYSPFIFCLSQNRSYRCPTCSRALINMDHYFRLLDVEVRRQPMPPPYDTWQTVILWYENILSLLIIVMIAQPRVEYLFTSLDINAICNLTSKPR